MFIGTKQSKAVTALFRVARLQWSIEQAEQCDFKEAAAEGYSRENDTE